MLNMLEWLCDQLMEAEISQQLGAAKSEHSNGREGYRSGYRPRRLDTRMGTMYLLVPKARNGGYIPFFVTERKRGEAALVEVVQEAFVQGVSTRKIEKLAKRLGIENLRAPIGRFPDFAHPDAAVHARHAHAGHGHDGVFRAVLGESGG